MRDRAWALVMVAGVCATACAAPAGSWADGMSEEALGEARRRFESTLSQRMFDLLPPSEQDRILIGMGMEARASYAELAGPFALAERVASGPLTPFGPMSDVEAVSAWADAATFARLSPVHRRLVAQMARAAGEGRELPVLCLGQDAPPELVEIVESIWYSTMTFQTGPGAGWSQTAVNGGNISVGEAVTITWSFVPDGTLVTDCFGGQVSSQMFVWLNGLYGNQANWQPLFEDTFARWSELTGNTYIFEPNDDGVAVGTGSGQRGVVGVRGDVRIGAGVVDGNSGVLACNFFPNGGDMTLDAFDSYYGNLGGNSLRMRNILAHEHGHGLGLFHVCPRTEEKLMEPFISVAFDGPQLDDRLAGQRLYGDPFEPNDGLSVATPLGPVERGGTVLVGNLSLDDTTDVDVYFIASENGGRFEITATPDAAQYQSGGQTSQCNSGPVVNYNALQDISLAVVSADGGATLASSDASGSGEPERLSVSIPAGGAYLVVDGTGPTSGDEIQAYRLLLAPGAETLALSSAVPSRVAPGETVTIEVEALTDGPLASGPVLLFGGGAAPSEIDLVPLGGDRYAATLPAFGCGEAPVFAFRATTAGGTELRLPEAGTFGYEVGVEVVGFEDSFTSDRGWTVGAPGDDATTGLWQRGTPTATDAQPGGGVDDGSCFATGLSASSLGSNDVDNGRTTLISPRLDLSSGPATVAYSRWYSNSEGASPNADVLEVEISNDDGLSWTGLEVVGPGGAETDGGWFDVSFDVSSVIAPTGSMRVRFVASDEGSGSVVEAAVDRFRVGEGVVCETCPGDLDANGTADVFDILIYFDRFGNGFGDIDGSGVSDVFDILGFFGLFTGC